MNIKQLIRTCEEAIAKRTTVVLSIAKGARMPAGFPKGNVLFTAVKDTSANGVRIPAGAAVTEFEAGEVIDWIYGYAQERKKLIVVPRGALDHPKA